MRWSFLGVGIAGYVIAIAFVDPLFFEILVQIGLLIVAVPTGAALIIFWHAVRTKSELREPAILLSVFLGTGGLLAVSEPINSAIQSNATAAAKAYPDRVAPLLEQYRQQHGVYPAHLSDLPAYPRVPHLLWGIAGYWYHSNGQWYSFRLRGSLIDDLYYYSDSHQWHAS